MRSLTVLEPVPRDSSQLKFNSHDTNVQRFPTVEFLKASSSWGTHKPVSRKRSQLPRQRIRLHVAGQFAFELRQADGGARSRIWNLGKYMHSYWRPDLVFFDHRRDAPSLSLHQVAQRPNHRIPQGTLNSGFTIKPWFRNHSMTGCVI